MQNKSEEFFLHYLRSSFARSFLPSSRTSCTGLQSLALLPSLNIWSKSWSVARLLGFLRVSSHPHPSEGVVYHQTTNRPTDRARLLVTVLLLYEVKLEDFPIKLY